MSKHLNTYTDVLVSMVGTAFAGILAFFDSHAGFFASVAGISTFFYTLHKWWIFERRQKEKK